MALFHAHETFPIRSRQLFCIIGDVTEGTIKAGMLLKLPRSSSLGAFAEVVACEFVNRIPANCLAMVVDYQSDEQLRAWQKLAFADEVLEVVESEGA